MICGSSDDEPTPDAQPKVGSGRMDTEIIFDKGSGPPAEQDPVVLEAG